MIATASRLRKQEGFTLIELMIVIVVLGILAGLVLLGMGSFTSDAKAAKKTANDDTCATAQAAADAYNEAHPDATQRTMANYMKNAGDCTVPPANQNS